MSTNSSISKVGVYHVHLNAAKVSSCPPVITLFWWRSSVLVNTIIPRDLKAARDKESSRAKQQEGGSVARNNGPLCSGRKWSPLRGDEGAPVTPAADGSISATGTCLGFSAQLGLHLCANVCVWQPHRWSQNDMKSSSLCMYSKTKLPSCLIIWSVSLGLVTKDTLYAQTSKHTGLS